MKRISCLLLTIILSLIFSGCVQQQPLPFQVFSGAIDTNTDIHINSNTMKLTFGSDTYIEYDEGRIDLSNTTHDLSEFGDGDKIYFDPKTERLSNYAYHRSIQIGIFHLPLYMCELETEQELLFVNQISAPLMRSMHGKKVVCLGDSMTEGIGTTKVYSEWFPELCGFVSGKDLGLGGSCISPKVDEIPTWENGIASFYERYTLLEDDADVIIVFGCVNDWTTGRELGTISDTNADTFYGAMQALCGGLKEKYPSAQIFFFSSPQNNYAARPANDLAGTPWEGNTEGYNRKGLLLQDYATAMEEVCAKFDVHFHSLTEAFPWGADELGDHNGQTGTYGSDALHPNAEGHALIAQEMATFIQNTFAETLG